MIDNYVTGTYSRIMLHEAELNPRMWAIPTPEEIYCTAKQILEVAKSNLVLRSYNIHYDPDAESVPFHPQDTKIAARESDGGHTNLMSALVDRALSWNYGPDVNYTDDGYSYREVMEAVRRHDLPENVTGDTADNGDRDEVAKQAAEAKYQKWLSSLSPSREQDFDHKVKRLLAEMEGKTSPTGKLLYVADKTAAIIMTLCYDDAGIPVGRRKNDARMTARDLAEIERCDFCDGDDFYYASEMWTIDFLKTRHLVQYDDSGYFTALIVMVTLLVNGAWYNWREKDYSRHEKY